MWLTMSSFFCAAGGDCEADLQRRSPRQLGRWHHGPQVPGQDPQAREGGRARARPACLIALPPFVCRGLCLPAVSSYGRSLSSLQCWSGMAPSAFQLHFLYWAWCVGLSGGNIAPILCDNMARQDNGSFMTRLQSCFDTTSTECDLASHISARLLSKRHTSIVRLVDSRVCILLHDLRCFSSSQSHMENLPSLHASEKSPATARSVAPHAERKGYTVVPANKEMIFRAQLLADDEMSTPWCTNARLLTATRSPRKGSGTEEQSQQHSSQA